MNLPNKKCPGSVTNGLYRAAVLLGVGLLLGAVLAYPAPCKKAVITGARTAFLQVIPSVFPFMTLAAFLLQTGYGRVPGGVFLPCCRLVGVRQSHAGAAFFMGLLGGFTSLCVGVRMLHDQRLITRRQGEYLLAAGMGVGPAFIILTVGVGFFRSMGVGLALYGCSVLGNLCGAAFLYAVTGREKVTRMEKEKNDGIGGRAMPAPTGERVRNEDSDGRNGRIGGRAMPAPTGERVRDCERDGGGDRDGAAARQACAQNAGVVAALTDGVQRAAQACLTLCGFICFFQLVCTAVECSFSARVAGAAKLLTEVTNGTVYLYQAGVKYALQWALAALVWGGFSVHLQAKALLPRQFSLAPFYGSRLPALVFSQLFLQLLVRVFPLSLPTMAAAAVQPGRFGLPVTLSFFMLVAAFLYECNPIMLATPAKMRYNSTKHDP